VLLKPKASVEPREIDGRSSRWIRGVTKNILSSEQPFQPNELAIRVNATGCGEPVLPVSDATPSPAAEGLANTTPLVLESVFFPLGREPRQFDAFYLGSAEPLSKPGATVQLHFDMADPSFESLAYLRSGAVAQRVFAGIAGDGHLYLFGFNPLGGQLNRDPRGPLRPPSPGQLGAVVPGPPVSLDARPAYRAPVWDVGLDFFVAAAASDTVWVWQNAWMFPLFSGWANHGVVGPVDDSTQEITGLVHLADGPNGMLFALREEKLFVRNLDDANPGWTLVETEDGGTPVDLVSIAPICVQDSGSGDLGAGTRAAGLVGIDADDKLYGIALSGGPLAGTCHLLHTGVTAGVVPAAVRRADDQLVVVAIGNNPMNRSALAVLADAVTFNVAGVETESLAGMVPIGKSVDVNRNFGTLTFAVTVEDAPQSSALVVWTPFVSPLQSPAVNIIPAAVGVAGGAPSLLPEHAVVPATSSQVLVAPFHLTGLLTFQTQLRAAVIAFTAADELLIGDSVAIPVDANGTTEWELETVSAPGVAHGGQTLYEFNQDSVNDDFFVYRLLTPGLAGTPTLGQLEIMGIGGGPLPNGTILLIATDAPTPPELYTVIGNPSPGEVELDHELVVDDPDHPPANVLYKLPEPTDALLRPLLRLNAVTGNWPASLLARTFLEFPGADPRRQRGTAFLLNGTNPELVALGDHWTIHPPVAGNKVTFIVDGSVGDWSAQLGDPSSNPALSWEYSNGTGWWKLDPILDETLNLKRTGNVRFTVPNDLRPMDWAGRTNYWIRARLVGGDYGTEQVTVTTKPGPNPGETVQTIDRSSQGIRPPSVVKLRIAYRLCKAVRPVFVLAQDSGSVRDQSQANNTGSAVVEAFVPLAVALGRLSGESVVAGRALFLGLNATPSGAPVNVLLLVGAEAPHEQFAPMKIEALGADRFVPIVADDTTRALGESGLLSMSFAVEPTRRELFGMENLTWLRLTPGDGVPGEWKPSLRGAYLNAVWASAAETLTRELLGSSEGAPNLTVRVARPPVLADSLVLRVREPLGEEERELLRAGDPNRVLSDVDQNLRGDWVLWDRVIDPGDESPGARVYALDEATGEIRFGDGRHGRIPPIGRDSIVAFTYRRTEIGDASATDVPANSVTARTALNLVSPVESVEAVFAADRAAGGAPPESDERVVRFGTARLRHRGSAVTARDFEDLALESSPDIVQARCFAGTGSVRLVVVMRGADPLPDAAEVRELRRLLLASASAALSAPGALRIAGPRVRRLRIALKLRVASLDRAGDVSRDVQERLAALFDTSRWELGANPGDGDVARALLDTPDLEGLADVRLREVRADGEELAWNGVVRRDELAMLDQDALRLEFEAVEVFA
ncbi:MAG TPA: hypothetical protein VFP80_15220, partial [Thermoanaerobaculia bacterium]|nr:hypothetical protein [Thermoanaerobaculia bacterium]